MIIAALYVKNGGSYYGLPGVDPWDEARDARSYTGPHPIVAHPPCQRWGKLWAGQPLHIKRTGERKIKGDDAGCFAAALASTRKWGGVLDPAVIERMGLKRAKRLGEMGARGGGKDSAPRIGTPEPFRDLLIGIARSAGNGAQ